MSDLLTAGLLIWIVYLVWIAITAPSRKRKELYHRREKAQQRLEFLLEKERILQTERDQKFCALDCETTGLKTANARVIQIGLVLFYKGRMVGTKEWLINPGVRIPPSATKVNQITNDMLIGKPAFSDIINEVSSLIHRYPIVGHNIDFDYNMLAAEFGRYGMPFSPQVLACTMRNGIPAHTPRSRRPPWLRLSEAARELGIEPSGSYHNALVDAEVAGKIFVMRKTLELEPIIEERKNKEAELEEYNRSIERLLSKRW